MMQEEARERFIAMVRDCGTDIVRMQASFEMYLNQYLVDFPEEKLLLHDALKVGIAEKLIQHAGEPDYPQYLEKLGPRFAEASRRTDKECVWAVETFAIALGRTADYVPPHVVERAYPQPESAMETPEHRLVATTGMAIIVTSGGALGAALASMVLPLTLYLMGFYDAFQTGGNATGQYKAITQMAQIILFVILALMAAVLGGFAALAGWLFGQGAERPWATFSVAFGAAFTSFLIAGFTPCLPMLFKPIVLFTSVFGATYKSAARGGHY